MALVLAALAPAASDAASTIPVSTQPHPLSVDTILSLCRSHPAVHGAVWLRGWFIPDGGSARGTPGLLFQSADAVPLTTVDDPALDGHWTRYGAVYALIHTSAVLSGRELTLHGPLDCTHVTIETDHDPLPPPKINPTYSTTRAGPTGPVTASATAGGLRITLTVPHTTYPRGALVKVREVLRNISHHDVGVGGIHEIQVLGPNGKILFPPAMPYAPPLPGPAPPAIVPLGPGQTSTLIEYVILRGARIRAVEHFSPTWHPNSGSPRNTLSTRVIALRLTPEEPPQIALHASGGEPSADVTPPPGLTGKPLLLAYADCGFPDYSYTFTWVPTGLHLDPGCSGVQEWHVRLAWPNHPVAGFDYTAPLPTPTPAPIPKATATPTSSPTPSSASSTFDEILRRAARAMYPIHSVHVEGLRTSTDPSSRLNLRIHGDCHSGSGPGLPIRLRTITSGTFTEAGKRSALDDSYIITGPVILQPHAAGRAWERTAASHGRWLPVNLRRAWRLTQGISYPALAPDPAYTNQTCPDLLRLTYLTTAIPTSYPPRVLGQETLAGHRVWHLRERQWFKLDLYVDATTYRLLRLRLWDAPGPSISWQIRLDYSRFNTAPRIDLPAI